MEENVVHRPPRPPSVLGGAPLGPGTVTTQPDDNDATLVSAKRRSPLPLPATPPLPPDHRNGRKDGVYCNPSKSMIVHGKMVGSTPE